MGEYNYWTATEDHLRANGGKVPTCPVHGTEMFAEDDHGRYKCFDCGLGTSHDGVSGRSLRSLPIPQVTEDMPDDQKAKIFPLHRLNLPPTGAESELLTAMMSGEDYSEKFRKVDEERGR